jgi:hypothetical protein
MKCFLWIWHFLHPHPPWRACVVSCVGRPVTANMMQSLRFLMTKPDPWPTSSYCYEDSAQALSSGVGSRGTKNNKVIDYKNTPTSESPFPWVVEDWHYLLDWEVARLEEDIKDKSRLDGGVQYLLEACNQSWEQVPGFKSWSPVGTDCCWKS